MRNGLPVNPVKKWDERAKAGAWGGETSGHKYELQQRHAIGR